MLSFSLLALTTFANKGVQSIYLFYRALCACQCLWYSGQVLHCSDIGDSIRFILNDGVIRIGLEGCDQNDKHGRCKLGPYIAGLQKRLDSIDWTHDCLGNYTLPTNITDGRAPR